MFEIGDWEITSKKQGTLIEGLFGSAPCKVESMPSIEATRDQEKKTRKRKHRGDSKKTKKAKLAKLEAKNLAKRESPLLGVSCDKHATVEVDGTLATTSKNKEVQGCNAQYMKPLTQNSGSAKRKKNKKGKNKLENRDLAHSHDPENFVDSASQEFPETVMEPLDKDVYFLNDQSNDQSTDRSLKRNERTQKKRKKKQYDAPTVDNENSLEAVPQTSNGEENVEGTQVDEKRHPTIQSNVSKKIDLKEKMQRRLESSRFRWINEQLYTTSGDKAFGLFNTQPGLFDVYHRGFRSQVEHWPVNPVDVMIQWIKERSPSLVVADFGCGEAVIAQSVPNKVHSFDLVAKNDLVTACNMAKVPLKSKSVDVAIFCLSLMGTDLEKFLQEAHRVLKKGGILKIAEVVSRLDEDAFIESMGQLGFQLLLKDDSNKMFISLDFQKAKSKIKTQESSSDLPGLKLKPCIYKRR